MTARWILLASLLWLSAPGYGQPDAGVDEQLGKPAALDTVLNDENGQRIVLRDLIRKPTILTLNYFRCAGICTPILNGIAAAVNQVELQPGTDFQIVTVSFDPTDTPELAREKRVNYLAQIKRPFPPKAWRFLTGDAQSTKALADSVGFGFRPQGDQYMHAGVIIILTPSGTVSRYLYGVTFLPAEIQMALQGAAAGEVRPSVSRVLQFCYSYDPQGRRYVFRLTRVIGAVTLLFAGGMVVYLVRKGRSRRGRKQ